jgi:peptide/nickel transport system ATP-binding protein
MDYAMQQTPTSKPKSGRQKGHVETTLTEGTILQVNNLRTYFYLDEGILKAVDGVDFTITEGKTLGIVGESGCGKSVTAQSIMRIVPMPGQVSGELLLSLRKHGLAGTVVDLTQFGPNSAEIRRIRGGEIAMIFQEPMKAFSPVHTIGNQVVEAITLHNAPNSKEAEQIALDSFVKVGMSNPEQRLGEYPHQLSGGMRQRAMIAMALSCNPSILIADEPTTALDVTVQAQVLELVNELKTSIGTSVIFITHDLGVIAEMSDEVAVMYLGKVVEQTDVDTLFHGAVHPYTRALLGAIPTVTPEQGRQRLRSIEGTVPFPMNLPEGCGFFTRCKHRDDDLCRGEEIPLTEVAPGHKVRCRITEGSVHPKAGY